MRRTSHWVVGMALSCAGCGLVGYDFDGYRPQDASGGAAAASSGSGPGGSGSGGSAGQCTDGTQNNGETGTDCGGPCPPCACPSPSFQPRIDFPVTGSATGIDVADMDADGNEDVLVVSHLSDHVAVLFGDGTGKIMSTVSTMLPMGFAPQSVKAADFNADGSLDFVSTNYANGSITVFLNQAGAFAPQAPIGAGVNPWGITTAKLNGDDVTDLVVGSMASSALGLMEGNGAGNFMTAIGISYGGALGPQGVLSSDLDGDSDIDLVAAYQGSAQIVVYLRQATAMYGFYGSPYTSAAGPVHVAVADFNHDGHADIAASSSASMGGTLLLGDGNGAFATVMDGLAFGFPTAGIAAADFNGDNHMDIAASGTADDFLVVLAGNGDGSFQKAVLFDSVKNSVSIAATDLNHDGKADVVVGSASEPRVGVFLNACP